MSVLLSKDHVYFTLAPPTATHILYDRHPQVLHVGDDTLHVHRDLSVLY